ncbi:AraC family transcriptional regulator [Rhodovastum atsumiense]|uniref:AraC family transcriptional regulator n=2 Tax=Rhodovastum atsumiense TaxID=504468 RepID=A0A5M6IT78_9PROT|nr:AraC family transcriptional regulator [Rhodovastum atsumiense]CAH2600725.1 AraC family transcriptional regulator [Rhodovastum atsumiense]
MERRMIAACFVHDALDCARERGLPAGPLLQAAGIAPEQVQGRDGRVSAEQYGLFWREVAAALDDEFFGLAARPMRPGGFDMLCLCVLHSTTLGQALRRATRFLALMLDDPRGEVSVAGGLAWITLRDGGAARSAFAYRTYWILLHGVACWLVGRRIPLRHVDFRCAEPSHGAEYHSFFGAPVRFGQPASRLAFDAGFLRLPVNRSERALQDFLRRAPMNILVRYRHDAGLGAGIRRRLRALPPADWPDFEALAGQLRLPASTLRRRLREEGQSYRMIKDEIRRDLALGWLTNSDRDVSDIAAALGFAEPSAFHRAFRKWMAVSPGEYRRVGCRGGAAVSTA